MMINCYLIISSCTGHLQAMVNLVQFVHHHFRIDIFFDSYHKFDDNLTLGFGFKVNFINSMMCRVRVCACISVCVRIRNLRLENMLVSLQNRKRLQ